MRAALEGSRGGGDPLGVGDPWLSSLYQAAVKDVRVPLYGDDLSFLQAGHRLSSPRTPPSSPSIPTTTSRPTRRTSWTRRRSSGWGAVSSGSRTRSSECGGARRRSRTGSPPSVRRRLAVAGGSRSGEPAPGLWRGWRGGGLALALRVLQSILAGVFIWLHPVPALWLLLVPHLLLPWRRSWWTVLLALAPAVGLLAIGASAWWRGAVNGAVARAVGDRAGRARARSRVPRRRRACPLPPARRPPQAEGPVAAAP